MNQYLCPSKGGLEDFKCGPVAKNTAPPPSSALVSYSFGTSSSRTLPSTEFGTQRPTNSSNVELRLTPKPKRKLSAKRTRQRTPQSSLKPTVVSMSQSTPKHAPQHNLQPGVQPIPQTTLRATPQHIPQPMLQSAIKPIVLSLPLPIRCSTSVSPSRSYATRPVGKSNKSVIRILPRIYVEKEKAEAVIGENTGANIFATNPPIVLSYVEGTIHSVNTEKNDEKNSSDNKDCTAVRPTKPKPCYPKEIYRGETSFTSVSSLEQSVSESFSAIPLTDGFATGEEEGKDDEKNATADVDAGGPSCSTPASLNKAKKRLANSTRYARKKARDSILNNGDMAAFLRRNRSLMERKGWALTDREEELLAAGHDEHFSLETFSNMYGYSRQVEGEQSISPFMLVTISWVVDYTNICKHINVIINYITRLLLIWLS